MNAHTIVLDGYRHRYYASVAPHASHPPIVALHGFGLDGHRTFRTAARRLRARGVSLYALDLLGFGGSDAPDRVYSLRHYAALTAAFATALDLRSPVLLGHSMGGKIAAATLVLHPTAFSGLLLVNPGGFSWMASWLPLVGSTRWVNALLAQPWIRRHVLSRMPFGRLFARPANAEQALRLQHSHYALDLDATGLRSRLGAIEQPVGVLWGHRDAFLPASTLDRIRNQMPQARIYRIPRAGHFPMWSAPNAFADAVLRFVRCVE